MAEVHICSAQDFQEYQFIKDYSRLWSVFISSANVLLSIFAVFGNSLILFALYRCRSIHPSTKALFYSLALSDFGVGLLAQPLQVASGLAVLRTNLYLFCSIQPFYAAAAYFFCAVSFVTISAISIDRYLALHLRMRYRVIVTARRLRLTLAVLWICSIVWAVSRMWSMRVNKLSAIIFGFLSIVVTCSCYFRIYWSLKLLNTKIASQQARARRKNRKALNILQFKRSVNSMMCVFGFLIICYIPYFCSLLAFAAQGYNSSIVLATNLSSVVIFLNSSLNPFVYCWRINEIRWRVISIVRKLCPLCTKSNSQIQISRYWTENLLCSGKASS